MEELTQKEAEDAAAAAELQNALASSDEEAGGAPPEPPPTRQRTRSPNEEPDDPEPEDLGGVQGGDLHAGLNCEAPDPLQELLESDWNQADNKIAATVLKKPAQYRLNANVERKVRKNVSCMRGFLPVNHMRRLFGALVQVGVWLQSLLEPTSANFRTFSVIEVEVWDETPLVGRPSDAPADSKLGAATNTLQCHRTRTVRLVLDEGTNRRCNEGFRFCAIAVILDTYGFSGPPCRLPWEGSGSGGVEFFCKGFRVCAIAVTLDTYGFSGPPCRLPWEGV